jgi:hypothetical protein
VRRILTQIDFLGEPLHGKMVLSNLEEVVVLNGKENQAILVLLEHRLRQQNDGL